MKALGAAAASSGSVAMVHAVGVTPEAPTLEAATGGEEVRELRVTTARLRASRDELSTVAHERLGAVSVGTPHASLAELERLAGLLGTDEVAVPLYVNVGREVLAAAEGRGLVPRLEALGVRVVSDTCTYISPVMDEVSGPVMTDSAKWAWYAPANLGVETGRGGGARRGLAAERLLAADALYPRAGASRARSGRYAREGGLGDPRPARRLVRGRGRTGPALGGGRGGRRGSVAMFHAIGITPLRPSDAG